MNWKHRELLGVISLVLCFAGTAMGKENEVTRLLEKTPSWVGLAANDSQSRQQLADDLSAIAARPVEEVRVGVAEYIKAFKGGDQLAHLSKVYVLNRIMFKVPHKETLSDARFFGGWVGVPQKDQKVNMLWPVEIDSKGRLAITGFFSAYLGEDYAALDEFDFFAQKYGRRIPQVRKSEGQ